MRRVYKLMIVCIIVVVFTGNTKVVGNTNYQKIEYCYSDALFTVFSFINMGKYYQNDTLSLNPVALEVCKEINQNLSDSTKQKIKNQYTFLKSHYDWMLGYVSTMVAIHLTAPPDFTPLSDQLILFDKKNGTNNKWMLNQLKFWESTLPLLQDFWEEANITDYENKYRNLYDSKGKANIEQARIAQEETLQYLKISGEQLFQNKSIKLIINIIGPDGEMGPEFFNIIYDIKGGNNSYNYRPHEFIHSLVRGLTKSDIHATQIERIVQTVWESVKETPAAKSYTSEILYFEESLVRVLDNSVMLNNNPNKKFALRKALEHDYNIGFVLVEPILIAIEEYEKSSKNFNDFFEELLIVIENNLSQNQIQYNQMTK